MGKNTPHEPTGRAREENEVFKALDEDGFFDFTDGLRDEGLLDDEDPPREPFSDPPDG